MEWFPNNTLDTEEDDYNPKGTAVIEIDFHSKKVRRVIFVENTSYANGINFSGYDTNAMIDWIEQETGLVYGQQFHLTSENEGELHFVGSHDGIEISPYAAIEIRYDEVGNLTLYSIIGEFPEKENRREEAFTLTPEQVENITMQQLKLIDFPSFEKETLHSVYGIEEIFISNAKQTPIPFEFFEEVRSYKKMNQTVYWELALNEKFEREEIKLDEQVSIEQALKQEPSPDTQFISDEEQTACTSAVKDFLRRVYSKDSGKWMIKSLHRDQGYIHAILKENQQSNHVFKRKLTVIIDSTHYLALNYVDNKLLLDTFNTFEHSEEATITKKEAYEKIKYLLELKPVYVYDYDCSNYILCGKLDCKYGVDASSQEIIELDEL